MVELGCGECGQAWAECGVESVGKREGWRV